MLSPLLIGLYCGVQGASVAALSDYVLSQLENVRAKSTHKIVVRKDMRASRKVHVYTAHEFRLLREGNETFHSFVDSVRVQADWRDPVAELLLEGLIDWTYGSALLGPLARDVEDADLRDQITQAAGKSWAALTPAQQDQLFRWARMLDAQQAKD